MKNFGLALITIAIAWGGILYLNFLFNTRPLVAEVQDRAQNIRRQQQKKRSTISERYRIANAAGKYDGHAYNFFSSIAAPLIFLMVGLAIYLTAKKPKGTRKKDYNIEKKRYYEKHADGKDQR